MPAAWAFSSLRFNPQRLGRKTLNFQPALFRVFFSAAAAVSAKQTLSGLLGWCHLQCCQPLHGDRKKKPRSGRDIGGETYRDRFPLWDFPKETIKQGTFFGNDWPARNLYSFHGRKRKWTWLKPKGFSDSLAFTVEVRRGESRWFCDSINQELNGNCDIYTSRWLRW